MCNEPVVCNEPGFSASLVLLAAAFRMEQVSTGADAGRGTREWVFATLRTRVSLLLLPVTVTAMLRYAFVCSQVAATCSSAEIRPLELIAGAARCMPAIGDLVGL